MTNLLREQERATTLSLCYNIIKEKDKILDIGGKDGRLLKELKEIFPKIETTVYDKNPITCYSEINYVKGDIYLLKNINYNYYDLVILEEVIEHLPVQGPALYQAKQILKETGSIIITTPNKWTYRIALFIAKLRQKKFTELFRHTPDHINEINPRKLKKLLEQNDFKNIKIIGVNPYVKILAHKYPSMGIGLIAIAKK